MQKTDCRQTTGAQEKTNRAPNRSGSSPILRMTRLIRPRWQNSAHPTTSIVRGAAEICTGTGTVVGDPGPCSGQRPLLQALPGSPGASPYRLTPDNYDSRMSALSGPGETSDSAEFLTWSVRKINANPDRAESAWLGDSLFRQAAMRCRSTARRGIRQGGRRVWKATYGTVWPAFGGSRQQYGQSHVCL
jgi:hypothetical protein